MSIDPSFLDQVQQQATSVRDGSTPDRSMFSDLRMQFSF